MHIYKITNRINGKIYIGISTEKEKFRWYKHCSDAKIKPINLIDRAIAKHGSKNFRLETLEKIPKKKGVKYLGEREMFFINKFNSTNKTIGYNVALGGKVSVGYSLNESSKKKIGKNNKNTKKIIAYKLSGDFYKIFPSRSAASKELNITGIFFALNDKNKTAGGYQWKYYKNKNFKHKIEKHIRTPDIKEKKIYQWDKKNELINSFKSINYASRNTKIHRSAIQQVLKKNNKTAGGYRWTYESKIISRKSFKRKKNIRINVYNIKGKYIKTFESLKNCSEELNLDTSAISKTYLGKQKYIKDKQNNFYQIKVFYGSKDDIKEINNFGTNLIKKVKAYNLEGEFKKEFNSVSVASKELKIQTSSIRHAAKNKTIAKNYMFRWSEDCKENKILPYTHTKKAVLQYDFNGNFIKEYDTISKAARAVGVLPKNITRCVIHGGYSSAGFYWFKKKDNNFPKKIVAPVIYKK